MRILRPSNQIVSPSTTQVTRSGPKQMPKLARFGSMAVAALVVAGPPLKKITRNSAVHRPAVRMMKWGQRTVFTGWKIAGRG
ncbi:hypothetical protein SPHFLASMR4Y_00001 [Sphingorhabdus sp. SMR4y]|nr:hypothetical protein SPHFLASMR4Y_00001 [Sphingorhabdus sp. SMR4y]